MSRSGIAHAGSMAVLGRWFDWVMVLFFLIHIPTTILVDSQSVFPREWFPKAVVELLDWHIQQNNDTLVSRNPAWFQTLVAAELTYQLPFFFVAIYAFILQKKWIRIPALVYGVHTATTLIPILGHILAENNWDLAGIYVPYLVMPALLAAKMAAMPDPFPDSKKSKRE